MGEEVSWEGKEVRAWGRREDREGKEGESMAIIPQHSPRPLGTAAS